jgi:hypothetical protein
MLGTPKPTPRESIGKYARDLRNKLHNNFALMNHGLKLAHKNQIFYYDTGKTNTLFQEKDLVAVLFPKIKTGRSKKFAKTWAGPYVIVKKINDLNFQIKKVGKGKKLEIIHFNRMCKWPSARTFDSYEGDETYQEMPRRRKPSALDDHILN